MNAFALIQTTNAAGKAGRGCGVLLLIAIVCAQGASADRPGSYQCTVQVFKASPAVLVEKAAVPREGHSPEWTLLTAGDALLNPHLFRIAGNTCATMGDEDLEWPRELPPAIERLGHADMLVSLNQNANLFLERAAGQFTHSAALRLETADENGFIRMRVNIAPVASKTSVSLPAPGNDSGPAAYEYLVNLETWSCHTERTEDGAMLMIFVLLRPEKAVCP